MRKVEFQYIKTVLGKGIWTEKEIGLFHQWANDFEGYESGPANFTIALVEKEDGTIVKVTPEHIKFI